MITGKEYLKENIENTNIPEEHYTNEIGEMMEWYADDYHKEQVKKLTIPVVTQQSELLIDFAQSMEAYAIHTSEIELKEGVAKYLKSINCG